jgi:predicted DNA-binding transcriptional regulator AlpA
MAGRPKCFGNAASDERLVCSSGCLQHFDDRRKERNVIGIKEIAAALGITRAYADTLRYRGMLPEPDLVVGGRPAWKTETIEEWCTETGRTFTAPA